MIVQPLHACNTHACCGCESSAWLVLLGTPQLIIYKGANFIMNKLRMSIDFSIRLLLIERNSDSCNQLVFIFNASLYSGLPLLSLGYMRPKNKAP